MRHETFLPQKKELPICPINKQKANSLTVFNISFGRMNFASTERELFGKLFRLISLTKQRKNTITSKFSCFPWRGPKSLLKYDFFLPPMISSSFSFNFLSLFSKATISWQFKCFSVDKFTKIGRKYDSCLEKKSYWLWQKSKAFSFPSKAKTVRHKKSSCHEYIKNRVKHLFEASVAFSQPKSFIFTHNVSTCFYTHFCILHKDLFSKNYVSFVGQD